MDFTEEDFAAIGEARRRTGQNRVFVWVLAGILVIGVLIETAPDQGPLAVPVGSSSTASPSTPTAEAAAAPAAPSVPAANWSYSRRRDEVRNGEIVEAEARSTNSTQLGFPYGEVRLNVMVRRHPEWGLDVIFRVDEGQILCGFRDCRGTINFDGEAERLSLNDSADHNPTVVFAAYPEALLRKIQRSRRMIVELPFFQNGNRQFTFETGGLQWPPPSAGSSSQPNVENSQ